MILEGLNLIAEIGYSFFKITQYKTKNKYSTESFLSSIHEACDRHALNQPCLKIRSKSTLALNLNLRKTSILIPYFHFYIKFKSLPTIWGEPECDPTLIGNEQVLNEFFYWVSDDVFIERN
jgi:hypothetical protein